MKYKLNVQRDIDTDEPGVLILNLPGGWKFDHDPMDLCHTRGYDTMSEIRSDIKAGWIVPCDCDECKSMIAENI
jgi:hypothetical protein